MTAKVDGQLVTGHLLPVSESKKITGSVRENFADGHFHEVFVDEDYKVQVSFEKTGDVSLKRAS